LAGFGPYVAIYLADQKWTQEKVIDASIEIEIEREEPYAGFYREVARILMRRRGGNVMSATQEGRQHMPADARGADDQHARSGDVLDQHRWIFRPRCHRFLG
jgi:hypothetical protein